MVNSVVDMKMLEDKVLPWLNGSFGERYIFTQDRLQILEI